MPDSIGGLRHTGTVPLTTERLFLRRLTPDDADAMFANFASDEEVARYMSWPAYRTAEEVREKLTEWQTDYEEKSTYYWGIFLKDTDELIGTIYLYTEGEIALIGSVSYCIGKTWWGNGYMPEALLAVMRHGFCEIGYNRIEAYHAKSNLQSGRVMQKAGMTFDGVLRQRCKTYLGFEDCYFYSCLKEEFTP